MLSECTIIHKLRMTELEITYPGRETGGTFVFHLEKDSVNDKVQLQFLC